MNIRKVTALLLALLLAAVFPGCDSAGASTADAVLGRGGRSLRILRLGEPRAGDNFGGIRQGRGNTH